MTLKDAYKWISENAKDWAIKELTFTKIVITKNGVSLTILNDEILWKTANYENEYTIDLCEESLEVLTSADWVEQTYCRKFSYKTFVDDPNNNVWADDFVIYLDKDDFDDYGFITSIKWKADTDACEGKGTIYAKTVCSLDKETLNGLNEFIDIQIADGLGESYNVQKLVSKGQFYKQ